MNLEKIKQLRAKISRGKWFIKRGQFCSEDEFWMILNRNDLDNAEMQVEVRGGNLDDDAEFISKCPEIVDFLLARVEELYEEVISYRASINYHKWGEECRRLKEEKKQQKAHEDGLDAMNYTDGY
jgi:hypothetical protein